MESAFIKYFNAIGLKGLFWKELLKQWCSTKTYTQKKNWNRYLSQNMLRLKAIGAMKIFGFLRKEVFVKLKISFYKTISTQHQCQTALSIDGLVKSQKTPI